MSKPTPPTTKLQWVLFCARSWHLNQFTSPLQISYQLGAFSICMNEPLNNVVYVFFDLIFNDLDLYRTLAISSHGHIRKIWNYFTHKILNLNFQFFALFPSTHSAKSLQIYPVSDPILFLPNFFFILLPLQDWSHVLSLSYQFAQGFTSVAFQTTHLAKLHCWINPASHLLDFGFSFILQFTVI